MRNCRVRKTENHCSIRISQNCLQKAQIPRIPTRPSHIKFLEYKGQGYTCIGASIWSWNKPRLSKRHLGRLAMLSLANLFTQYYRPIATHPEKINPPEMYHHLHTSQPGKKFLVHLFTVLHVWILELPWRTLPVYVTLSGSRVPYKNLLRLSVSSLFSLRWKSQWLSESVGRALCPAELKLSSSRTWTRCPVFWSSGLSSVSSC